MATPSTTISVQGRDIKVTSPDKVYFPDAEGGPITKLEVVEYWVAVAEAALNGCRDRPAILHRFPGGVTGEDTEPFYQKRIPKGAPDWVRTATVKFPSGRTASMPVMHDEAALVWAATLGCLECNPWPVRADDVDHPDELRVDLDPTPGVPWDDVRRVALMARDVLAEHGLTGFPKTSGKRGIHVNARVERGNGFTNTRRAALAFAREVERRMPGVATTAWWKEERTGVFLDYNQNARDRTVASAYSIRPMPDARVSTPLAWDEVADVEPERFTVRTVPERLRTIGDPGAGIDEHAGTLDSLLELAAKDAEGGLGDAPWPPHFPKGDDEPLRVNPSRAKKVAEWEAMRQERNGKPRERPLTWFGPADRRGTVRSTPRIQRGRQRGFDGRVEAAEARPRRGQEDAVRPREHDRASREDPHRGPRHAEVASSRCTRRSRRRSSTRR